MIGTLTVSFEGLESLISTSSFLRLSSLPPFLSLSLSRSRSLSSLRLLSLSLSRCRLCLSSRSRSLSLERSLSLILEPYGSLRFRLDADPSSDWASRMRSFCLLTNFANAFFRASSSLSIALNSGRSWMIGTAYQCPISGTIVYGVRNCSPPHKMHQYQSCVLCVSARALNHPASFVVTFPLYVVDVLPVHGTTA